MGVNVVVSSQKFFNEYKNDVGFVSNLGDFTNNFTGVVGENVKFTTIIDINWSASVTANDSWSADTVAQSVSRSTGNWYNDGFSEGDVCDWGQSGVVTANITIDAISLDGSTIFYTLNSGAITDSNNAGLVGLTYLSAMVYKFGLLGNTESFNVESKVSGNDQGYYGSEIGGNVVYPAARNTNWVVLTRLGQYADWQTGSMRVRWVSNPAYDIQRFEIEHEFTIVPYFLDGQLSNLQNDIIPPLLNGLNTLKYAYSPGFRTVLSNPNTEKATVIDNSQGSVAWFNENFNGFQNNYAVSSITYEEEATGNPADGLLIGTKTKVTIDVTKILGTFSAGERAGVYVSQLPQQIEYEDTLTDLKSNFLYDNAINNAALPFEDGQTFLTNFVISAPFGNTMSMSFDVEYSSGQKTFLANKFSVAPTYFLIGVELGDVTLASGNSDRVILIADTELYDESADIPGLMDVTKFDFYPHNKQIGVDTGFTDLITWNEDGFVLDFEFSLNLLKDAVLKSMSINLIAYNNITEDSFTLDTYNFNNIGTAQVSAGVQQFNENTTRGYNLASGDQFNDVTLITGALVGDDQFYSGRFAQKISWQDWIQNLGVNNIFYDVLKPLNNKNRKSSNYSDLNGYTIRMSISANLDGTSDLGVAGNTNYLFLSPEIPVYDYDLDGNVTPTWSAEIQTFHPVTGVNLQGAVLVGLNTIMVTTWTNIAPPITSVVNMWAIHRIEETAQNGYAIDELSTINPYPVPNRVIPSVGETQLTIDPVSGNVVTACLVDGSQIIQGFDYNLSARLNEDGGIPIDGKITEAGVEKITEASVTKIIE